jgi:thiosulfate/3-mercaptopyruvate sulfurtransferase
MNAEKISGPLIKAVQLQSLIGKGTVCVVDCRFSLADTEQGRVEYGEAHIVGAHYLHLNEDLSGMQAEHGGRHPFPAADVFAARLATLGIDKSTHVVAYDNSRFAFASRLWWMLRCLGMEQVQVLNGGFSAWVESGGQINSAPAESSECEPMAVEGFQNCLDRASMLKAQALGAQLVDAREAERYQGLAEPIDPVAGHIPGAINVAWQKASNEAGVAIERNQQKQLWEPLGTTDEIVVYCGSGVTACVDLLSLELAGYPLKKLYMGSWSDWCSYL